MHLDANRVAETSGPRNTFLHHWSRVFSLLFVTDLLPEWHTLWTSSSTQKSSQPINPCDKLFYLIQSSSSQFFLRLFSAVVFFSAQDCMNHMGSTCVEWPTAVWASQCTVSVHILYGRSGFSKHDRRHCTDTHYYMVQLNTDITRRCDTVHWFNGTSTRLCRNHSFNINNEGWGRLKSF